MRFLKNNSGLTLIETIVSLVILIIIITSFCGSVLVSLKSETTATNLDLASSMAASIFDYLADADNLKIILENDINIEDGSYENKLSDFIANDINSSVKNNFLKIYKNYKENSRFNYLDKTQITITDRSDIVDSLYNVNLNIFWQSSDGEGHYNIETMIGAD